MSTVRIGWAVACRLQRIWNGSAKVAQLRALQVAWSCWSQANCTRMKNRPVSVVVVLGGFFDVAAALQQETGDGVHQPQGGRGRTG
jgi:hypothetical protein